MIYGYFYKSNLAQEKKMITELYEDVDNLEKIKHSIRLIKGNADEVEKILDLINPIIREKNSEIGKIQDEHNRRSLEDLLGRKL
jgi:prefoldin subunit 5